jgi:PAS domain S-box-containing protein
LLARRDGNEVVYLNELRHRTNTALKLRIPLSQENLPAARGTMGFEGILTGIDYRGVPVLAAVRKVPETPWIMVAKIDLKEIHAPIEEQVYWLGLIACSVVLTIGTGVTLILRDLRAQINLQRYRAELEQRALRGHYDYLSRFANDIILLAGADGRILEANDRAVSSYGYSREELMGMPLQRLEAPERLAAFEKEWRRTEQQESVIFETRHLRKDGSTFPVEVSARRVKVDEAVFLQSIIRDITERKEAERERARLQEQLQQSQRLESIGRLAGGVAHDFNNLLTVINGYSSMAVDALPAHDPLRDSMREVFDAGQRATSLTRQLLAFSRKQLIAPKLLNLNTVVSDLVKMLRRLVGEDVAIITDLASSLEPVFVDPGQMEQVLMNLATNARDAMPRGGKLIIETQNVEVDEEYAAAHVDARPGRYVLLAVTDTGEGMSAETLKHAFEPFFTTKLRGQGTGLGLATVYGAVKQSNGWIWAYSEPGKGTTFKIYLPRAVAGESPGGGEHIQSYAGAHDVRGNETVLVVEDQAEVRKLMVEGLTQYGYRVIEAGRGDEALTLCGSFPDEIHLLITDVVMPGITGPEVASRAASARPRMRVLYISGYTENLIAHQGVLDAGVAYLQKPFTAGALAQKVREVLDNTGT